MGGMKCKRRKRLVRGKDFDAWAARFNDGSYSPFSKHKKGLYFSCGKWVRVRFVEVK